MVEEFQYVVERKAQERICFLSTRERGLTHFKKEQIPSKYYNLEISGALYKTLHKKRSNRGVGGLAELGPRLARLRLEHVPPPTQYNLEYKKDFEECVESFGLPRISKAISKTPGPGAYNAGPKCRTTKMINAFGGRVRMDPVVEVQCIPKPVDMCEICQTLCKGDYWHYNYSVFVCLNCMQIARKKKEKIKNINFQQFRKLRDCSFMHRHDGTYAAVRLLKKNEICSKYRKENYLERFVNKYI